MTSLMEKYNGDFKKICENFAERLSPRFIKPNSKKEFIDWMYLSKDYSENNYEAMFFDPLLYWHCFSIHKKINDAEKEQQHLMFSCGKVGTGKTTLLAQMCSLIDPTFNSKRVYYLPEQFFKGMINAKPGEAHMIDEGGNFFKSINTSGKNARLLSQYLQMARSKRLFLGIAYDDYQEVMKDVRHKVDSIVMKGAIPKRNEIEFKRSVLLIPLSVTVKTINGFIDKRKEDVPSVLSEMRKIGQKPVAFQCINSKEFPTINDINPDSFKKWKNLNVKAFEEKIANDIAEFNVEQQETEVTEDRFIPISKYAKKYGFHPETIKRKIKAGVIPGKFMLGKWLVNVAKAEIEDNKDEFTSVGGDNILSNNTPPNQNPSPGGEKI